MSTSLSKPIETFIDNYCSDKKYTVQKKDIEHGIQYVVTNLTERITVQLYHKKGSITIGGNPKSKLKKEFDDLKERISSDPEVLEGLEKLKVKSCTQKYIIIGKELQGKVKDALGEINGVINNSAGTPGPNQSYRSKLIMGSYSLTVTQFDNSTLLLQGKLDSLFDEVCDAIEKTANPSENEVVSRFVSSSEENLEALTNTLTPDLLVKAEENVRVKLGEDAFTFMESHDQKWFVAAECLRLANIPLPEYSPIVMPASKAFEGFSKKLLLALGFYPATHFSKKEDGFTNLKDKTYAGRTALLAKEKYAGTYIDKLALALDMTRNFMMHSDGSNVTKVKTFVEANDKLDEILRNAKEIFTYFKMPEFGGL